MWVLVGLTLDAPITYTPELWQYLVHSSTWTKPTVLGSCPPAAVGSSMCAVGPLCVCGGLAPRRVMSLLRREMLHTP